MKSWIRRGLLETESVSGAMSDDDIIGRAIAAIRPPPNMCSACLGRRSGARRSCVCEREPKFAAEVAFWEARLGGLAEGVAPVAPPAEVWQRIDAAISAGAKPMARRAGLWQSLAFWRSFAIASAALAAASIAGLIYVAQIPSAGAPLLARLDAESGQASFVAAVDAGGNSLTIVPAALLSGDQQKAFELWLIPPGDKPHSLGLIDPYPAGARAGAQGPAHAGE